MRDGPGRRFDSGLLHVDIDSWIMFGETTIGEVYARLDEIVLASRVDDARWKIRTRGGLEFMAVVDFPAVVRRTLCP